MNAPAATATTPPKCGLRWSAFGKDNRITHKEKWFRTEQAREAFANLVAERADFHQIEAWCDEK